MRYALLLAVACVCTTRAALAQTVVPPGTVPGAQTVTTPDMRNAGSPQAPRRTEKELNLDHQDRKQLRKMSKVKPMPGAKRKGSY